VASFPLPVATRRLLAAAALALVVLFVGLRHLGGHGAPPALRVAPVRARAAPARTAAGGRLLVVDVEGAVRRPGLVKLPAGARVADAVARGGGFARRADRGAVNLAAPVSDGQQVLVPRVGALAAAGAASGGAATAAPVSLSSATPEQLDGLPGIGPVTAQKILSYRQQHGAFHSVEELDAIPGIGPARLAELQGLVVP
jgi:competence protein ComEA